MNDHVSSMEDCSMKRREMAVLYQLALAHVIFGSRAFLAAKTLYVGRKLRTSG